MDDAELVDALDHVWSSTSAVLHGVDEPAWELPTGCPGWTVRDQVSHLVWSAGIWLGVAPDPIELPELAHVRGPVGAYMELTVHARRGRAGQAILAEFDASRAAAVDDLRSRLPNGLDEPIAGPMGYEMPRSAFLAVSVFDQWVHGHDICLALDIEPDRSSPAARHAVAQIFAAWSTKAGDAPGVDVTIAVVSADRYDVEHGVAASGAALDDHAYRVGAGDAVASIELGFDDFVTRVAGRDRPAGAPEIAGDESAARAVLDLLPITP